MYLGGGPLGTEKVDVCAFVHERVVLPAVSEQDLIVSL